MVLAWPRRFSEFITIHSPHADLPVLIEEPGIWISSERPYLAGSPDGVINECFAVTALDTGGAVYHCRRSLIEIKDGRPFSINGRPRVPTPFKLRKREVHGEFYPLTQQLNNRCTRIPASYSCDRSPPIKRAIAWSHYDQITGNMWTRRTLFWHRVRLGAMMGLGQCYFVVLTPSGFQVILEPLDVAYCTQHLVPALDRFFRGTHTYKRVGWGLVETTK